VRKGLDSPERLQRYAELIVRVGANVAPGQYVAVDGLVEHVELVRAVADAAYDAGASFVDVRYADLRVKHSMIAKAPEDALTFTTTWMVERLERLGAERGAQILIAGNPDPQLFSDLDPARVGAARQVAFDEAHMRNITTQVINWTIAPFPTAGWAEHVYGEPDLERLWDELGYAVRLDVPDPVEAWRAHIESLGRRARSLNDQKFDALRFTGDGTDLTIGLLPGSRWLSAALTTTFGRRHVVNLPTEEVYTTPDRARADGVVRASRPLVLPGGMVCGLELRFERGRVVAVEAEKGGEYVRAQLAADEGAAYLGEVALVDSSSRVGHVDHPFFNGLLDENAASHIAYGSGFPYAVEGADRRDPQEQVAAGINHSGVHTDVMVGGPGTDVVGITAKGDERSVVADNVWQLT